ncbi:serine/threonine-protein kinase [Streptosporangium roseum]|uniref:Serine/threonine protein kinase-like protein n=1 Tax=Streptosporangium roseum (strain ATCC 12428 / DSM 43021 / JCM 3005 / KCTC 9067 / NCIMB 10171 / NRRL 2505 / NI 9100) TaxID=479432 RepID=D2BCC2_STRRD|nr:serine/threonine-protein kinase [Streptosporangium roseum]ACZ89951.1 Serine/threonine protein kinase-like protein [Streptosporangium roseum DSM 43021]
MGRPGRVGPYTLAERLGRGGMGEVYRATNRRGESVALKMLHEIVDADSEARIRLEREVRALRRVESPYVARVVDADLACERPYLVMEHIEGDTLLDRVRRSGPLKGSSLVTLAQGLAAALSIIHAAGVVHRDLKPANVLVNAEDEPVLIDFGIAQVLDATRLTLTGTFLGTPSYAAPELFVDEPVGEPADVHAWAATVAFAATGRPTFGRGTVESQMYAILNGQADLAGIPAALLPLIRAALHREAAKRPTAALLAARLARLARVTSPERAPSKAVRQGGEKTGVIPPRKPEPRVRSGAKAEEPVRSGRAAPRAGESDRGARPAAGGEGTPRAGRPAAVTGEPSRTGRPAAGADGAARAARPVAGGDGATRGGRPPSGAGETSRGGRTASGGTGGKPVRGTRKGRQADGAQGSEGATGGRAGPLPAGNGALLLLAVLAVPCVVATVIWPLATFAVTGLFAVLARTIWAGRWLVRKRKSARVRGVLRVVGFPPTFVVSLVTALAWPGLPAAALAGLVLWLVLGASLPPEWWLRPAPVAVAGIVFGVVCGGIIGREVERISSVIPELRKEGLRALAVLGGFVAVCAAAVRAIALLV